MNERKKLCDLDAIPDHGASAVQVESATGGFELILLREGNQVFAYHNECPHAGRKLDYAPGQFLVKDRRIICAAHGASFAVATGNCLGGPARNGLAALVVEVEDGVVFLGQVGVTTPHRPPT